MLNTCKSHCTLYRSPAKKKEKERTGHQRSINKKVTNVQSKEKEEKGCSLTICKCVLKESGSCKWCRAFHSISLQGIRITRAPTEKYEISADQAYTIHSEAKKYDFPVARVLSSCLSFAFALELLRSFPVGLVPARSSYFYNPHSEVIGLLKL